MTAPRSSTTNDVAIIGVSGRFPRARSVGEFWANLRGGVECISRFTVDDLTAAGVDPMALNHPSYVNAGGVVDDIELFDAEFFGFNAREAEITDPQQRLFLECAWEALEDAAYDPHQVPGLVGVFGGVGMSRYLFNILSNPELMAAVGQVQIVLGNDKDHLTTRVAYKLNLKGPAITVQTACSTSLVAVALAYQSLIDFQCDMALAGGATIGVPQKTGYLYQPGSINSPDGHCRVFDADAMGTVGGDGVAVVLLKRYDEAVADGDAIHAVIKGAALNNDGSNKVGYTAPSIEGQASVIAMAQAIASVAPDTITYVEAHGTGTPLGDPIEMAALTQVFRASTRRRGYCAIGSVKSNIGHLDCAAGIAGLIKAVLALEHGEIPPSLHFQRPNPKIDFDNSPFYVNTELRPWPRNSAPRRAGVSSFGIGGTNAHVVLEEAPPVTTAPAARAWTLLPLSARTPTALDAVARNLGTFLDATADASLADVAYTCAVGRRAFACRRAVVAQDVAGAGRLLIAPAAARPQTSGPSASNGARKVAFLFPGQGAQHPHMGAALFRTEPTFRTQLELCARLLRPHLGFNLLDALYPSADQEAVAAERLQETAITQPALFAIEYALARLLDEWGIRPHAMIGHSIGEYVAACLSGVFSLEEALALVARRGQLMQAMPRGAMLAVSLSPGELQPILDGSLDVAAINSPSNCVLSGSAEAIERAQAHLTAARVPCQRLHTSHAFHSRLMAPAAEAFVEAVVRAGRRAPAIPFVSNVTGDWISPVFAIDPTYWARHLRQPVRLADGLARLLAEPDWVLLEVGPGVSLSTLARQHPERRTTQLIATTMRHPKDARPDEAVLLDAVGQVWTAGVDVDWPAFYRHEQRRRVHLPTYPFERQRYWVDARRMTPAGAATNGHADARTRTDPAQWFYRPHWEPRPLPVGDGWIPDVRGGWLLFMDDSGVGDAIAAQLTRAGRAVARVTPGNAFARTGERSYAVRPHHADDQVALLHGLEQEGVAPANILHLWTLTANDAHETSETSLLERGFYSLLFLAQALGRRATRDPVRLIVASNGLHAISGSEPLRPEKATVLGPVRVIPQEQPNVFCRSVDIAVEMEGDEGRQRIAGRLIAELSQPQDEPVVAYRGEVRLIQQFRPAPDLATITPARLPEHAVWLITGGMGGIGLALAEWLARESRARLVLVGRSAVPAREAWDAWLRTHDASERTSRAIAKIRQIEAAGVEVLALQGDVASRDDMSAAIAAAHARFGAIHGVIHAAGVAGGGMLQRKTAEAAARVLAPKVEGALILDELLRQERAPQIVMLCASLSGDLGGFGQIDYCAANAFLDAFAQARSARGHGRTIAIDWDTWQEVGMAVDTEVPRELMAAKAANLELGLTNREGADVFARAIAGTDAQVLVSTLDLGARMTAYAHQHAPAQPEAQVPSPQTTAMAAPAAEHPRPALDSAYEPPRTDDERVIARIWAEMLGVSPVGVHDDFFALGGHSLLAIQVVSRLREAFHVEVPVHVLFDAPTVAQLAATVSSLVDGPPDEGERVDSIMRMVEGLSDEDVRRMLDEGPSADASGPRA